MIGANSVNIATLVGHYTIKSLSDDIASGHFVLHSSFDVMYFVSRLTLFRLFQLQINTLSMEDVTLCFQRECVISITSAGYYLQAVWLAIPVYVMCLSPG